ncbi:MAG TPA: hypothetical protein VJJ52_04160 [Candidatus Nanoarchaeia archaeon]|nr:hypothetical protein [Candidatus Nanoarchaeia archaeon]
MQGDLVGFGPLLGRARSTKYYPDLPREWILKSDRVEVYYLPAIAELRDPEFHMFTDDGVLVKFAFTGDILSVHKIAAGNEWPSLEAVVEMDPQHRFHLHRSNLPVNGVIDDKTKAPEQLLEQIINYSYARARSVEASDSLGIAGEFQALTYDAIVSRFKLLQSLQSSTDIIPDQSPRTIFAKAGDGCGKPCLYCPERNAPFQPYTRAQYIQHLTTVKRALTERYGQRALQRMNEGFINVSDIARLDIFYRLGQTDLTSVDAAVLMRVNFPWLEKIGAFISTPSALQLSEDSNGDVRLGDKRYSREFFHRLSGSGYLINRLYLGLETAHTDGSQLLGKNETYDGKLTASNLIQYDSLGNRRIGLKVIVQLGVLGKGFYKKGHITPENFVPWEENTDTTIRWIKEARPYHVLESVFQPYDNLPVLTLMKQGKIVPYESPDHIEVERQRLRRGIMGLQSFVKNFQVDGNYHEFLPVPPELRHQMVIPRS